jgi:hypothetical protein
VEFIAFTKHLDQFHREFDIDTSPHGRAEKLFEEVKEFDEARDSKSKEDADDEAIDVMICAIANVIARGISSPLDACYFKLERTAVKYRLRALEIHV